MSRGVNKASGVVAGLAAVVILSLGAGAAAALPSTGYATWTIAAAAGGFSGTVALPVGFPAVTFATDSRAPATINTGASTFISPASSFGIPFGSSANRQYLSLRPKTDAPGNPSTTTFSFASPTPVGGWGYVAGDIDAETVTLSATDSAGNPVPAAALGVSAFNYCTGPGSSCGTVATVPTVTAAGNVVTVADLNCTPVSAGGTCDTSGESAWLNPTVALSTLTITSEGKQGFSQFQNWFATVGRTISGTATTDCSGVATVELLNESGAVIATSAIAAGTFSFPLVAARSDYTVREAVAGATSAPAVAADVSAADANALEVTAECAIAAPVPPGPAAPNPPELAATGPDALFPIVFALVSIALGITLRVRRQRSAGTDSLRES